VRAPIELSPERQLELAVEAAQQDALRRVELEQAALEQAAARRQMMSPVDGLERGMWLEFRTGGGARKVKLAWVSPLRTLFIFSGAGRREAFSLPAEKLAAAAATAARACWPSMASWGRCCRRRWRRVPSTMPRLPLPA
jgi:hypothetical protein